MVNVNIFKLADQEQIKPFVSPNYDKRKLRNALGSFPTGVTVVTSVAQNGQPIGLTVNSFASVSLDPPLVLWSQMKGTPTHKEILAADRVVINVLACDQREIAEIFARPSKNKFENVLYELSPHKIPILSGCSATFLCSLIDHYHGGDHTIHLCYIESYLNYSRAPLIFSKGEYIERHLKQQ